LEGDRVIQSDAMVARLRNGEISNSILGAKNALFKTIGGQLSSTFAVLKGRFL
jgi:hypothetical protein